MLTGLNVLALGRPTDDGVTGMGTQSQDILNENSSRNRVQTILVAPYWLVTDPVDRLIPSVQQYLQDFLPAG